MIQNTILNIYQEHPFKHQLKYYGIKQYDLAKSIGINQSSLSKMLSGVEPMREIVEDEIQAILEGIKQPKRKLRPIIKRKKP
jgi:DNA transposition AAA+ family ATPase